MGILKKIGKLGGKVTELVGDTSGYIIGGGTKLVGEVFESEYIKDIGNSVQKASSKAGKTLGDAFTGAGIAADGIVHGNSSDINDGLSQVGKSIITTGYGMANGVKYITESGLETIDGIISNDKEKISNGTKKLIKVAAVSILAVGVADQLDLFDGDVSDFDYPDTNVVDNGVWYTSGIEYVDIDDVDFEVDDVDFEVDDTDIADTKIDDVDFEEVDPHYVEGYTRSDGTEVEGYFRDGDGNPNTTLTPDNGGGYFRS